MSMFILILAIVTTSGELQMHTEKVKACPDEVAFVETLQKMKADGEIKDWNAQCLTIPLAEQRGA